MSSTKLPSKLIMLSLLIMILKIKDILRKLCSETNNCDFIKVCFNSGVAHALRIGTKHAGKYKPAWLLFLDDDTILMNNAIKTALNLIALRPIKSRIGSI